jgi:hypothetical protein
MKARTTTSGAARSTDQAETNLDVQRRGSRGSKLTGKLVVAAATGLADPVGIVDLQRQELLVGLREAERAALAKPDGSVAALLLEGVVLRLQADLRWLEGCALDAPAQEFAAAGNVPSSVQPWTAIRADDYRVIALDQKVLLIGTSLLAMLAIASIAVVVGGRMAEQTRRVGLLKAVRGDPGAGGRRPAGGEPAPGARRGDRRTRRRRTARVGARQPGTRAARDPRRPRRTRRTLLTAASLTTAVAMVVAAQTSTALARALGATPPQISAGLTTAQLLPGLVAACVGIPAGLLLYQLAGGQPSEATPPLVWLLGVIPGTLITVAAVTAIPAWLNARRRVAEILRAIAPSGTLTTARLQSEAPAPPDTLRCQHKQPAPRARPSGFGQG